MVFNYIINNVFDETALVSYHNRRDIVSVVVAYLILTTLTRFFTNMRRNDDHIAL